MYRVFEALDELGAIVEEARGVPMTAGCMVPRGDVLELLDDIKDAIPGELDDAQDVLDARDGMLREAKQRIPPFLAEIDDPRASLSTHSGCAYCGGLGHSIQDCPKLEEHQRRATSQYARGDSGGY